MPPLRKTYRLKWYHKSVLILVPKNSFFTKNSLLQKMTRILSAHPQWSVLLSAYTNLGWESYCFHNRGPILTLVTILWNIKLSTTCHLSPGTNWLWYTLSQDIWVLARHLTTLLCFNIQAQANIQGPQCTSLLNVSQGSPTSPKCRCLMSGIHTQNWRFKHPLLKGSPARIYSWTFYKVPTCPILKMLSQTCSIFSLT